MNEFIGVSLRRFGLVIFLLITLDVDRPWKKYSIATYVDLIKCLRSKKIKI